MGGEVTGTVAMELAVGERVLGETEKVGVVTAKVAVATVGNIALDTTGAVVHGRSLL